jgi:hypothetical protein
LIIIIAEAALCNQNHWRIHRGQYRALSLEFRIRRMRKLARLIVPPLFPLLLPGCGAGPPPTAPATSAPVFSILNGAYTLTLTMSSAADTVCTGGLCTGLSLCVGTAGAALPPALATPVHLDHSGDTVTVTTDDPAATFRIDLRMSGMALQGTAIGQFRDGAVQASVTARDGRSAATTTAALMPASVAGKIDGQVSIGGYACANNAHTWTLARR